ncbi:nitroreductase [Rhodobacteraceae bacterium 63075]|nr:nitroreductase [Rhodobacteraceae bacterium 63075]
MTAELVSFEALLAARHSCRAYLPRAVPRELIERVTDAAARAPSWCNAQPWQLVITEKDSTERLAAALTEHAAQSAMQPDLPWPTAYEGRYKTRRFDCGMQLYDAAGIARSDKPARAAQMMENFRFFGAPHMALVTAPSALGPYGAIDCGGFVTAFCLAARAAGLGSIPQAAPAGFAPFLRDWFALPEDRDILCAISFGYPEETAPINSFRTPRATAGEIIDWR